jgi:O-antigen/teichoic acid export membrane protein
MSGPHENLPNAEAELGARRPQTDRGRLARGSAANFGGFMVSSVFQFVLVLSLARGLTQHSAGVFLEGFAAVKLLTVGGTLGLDVTAVRYVALHQARSEHELARGAVRLAVGVAAVASLLLTLATFALAGPLSVEFGAPALANVLRIMSIGLPFAVLETVLVSASRGTGHMRAFVLVDQILDSSLRLALVWFALILGFGVTGAAIASAATSVVTFAAAVLACRDLLFGPAESPGRARSLIRFALFQWGTVLAGTGTLWADSLLLGIWRSPRDVAAYSVATRTVTLGLVFIQPIGMAFQPMISRLHAIGDIAEMRRLYTFATKVATIAGGPPLVLVAVLASPILVILYGHQYAVAAVPLAVLAAAQVTSAPTGPGGYIVAMIGRTDLTFQINAFVVVLNVVLNIILIPPYGMVGAGVAWAIAVLATNFLRLYQVWRCLRIHPVDRGIVAITCILALFSAVAIVAARVLDDLSPLREIFAVSGIALLALAAGTVMTGTLSLADLRRRIQAD